MSTKKIKISELKSFIKKTILEGFESELEGFESELEYVNLTPHAITVIDKNGKPNVFESSGTIARVNSSTSNSSIGNFDLSITNYNGVSNLPSPSPNKIYIVSAMVLSNVEGREDVVAPNTGQGAIRDEKGMISAVRGFTYIG